MTINLTPNVQSQIYMDKKNGYMLSMVEKLTPEVEINHQIQDEDEKKKGFSSDDKEKEPFFKQSDFTFHSIVSKKSLNNSIGSAQNFFTTLSNAGGNVKKAS